VNGEAGFVLEVQIVTPLKVESSFACVTALAAIFPVVILASRIFAVVTAPALILASVTALEAIFAAVTSPVEIV
jgi:hypothetical protein